MTCASVSTRPSCALLASSALGRLFIVSRSWRSHTQRTPAGETVSPRILSCNADLSGGRLLDGQRYDGVLDLLRHAVLQHWLLAADFLQGQFAALVVELLEPVEAVAAVAHHLAGLADPPAHLRVPSARVRIGSTGALDLPRIPAAHALDELVGFLRPPRAGLVLVHRAGAMNDRVNDGPGGLDDVLAGEERGVAEHPVAEPPLVRLHAAAGALRGGVEHAELDGLSDHALTRFLRTRADRDLHLGAQPEAHVVAHVRSRLLEHHLRRVVQLDEDLGHRLLEA